VIGGLALRIPNFGSSARNKCKEQRKIPKLQHFHIWQQHRQMWRQNGAEEIHCYCCPVWVVKCADTNSDSKCCGIFRLGLRHISVSRLTVRETLH